MLLPKLETLCCAPLTYYVYGLLLETTDYMPLEPLAVAFFPSRTPLGENVTNLVRFFTSDHLL